MGANIRANGRGMLSRLEPKSDILGVDKETAPGGVCAPYAEGLDANKERRMDNRSNLRTSTRHEIAADYLARAAADLARATVARIRYAALARDYGMTNQAIGDALGVTEKAVRALLSRNVGGGPDE